jgi:hypothetical protein
MRHTSTVFTTWRKLRAAWSGSRTIPHVPWRASSAWKPAPATAVVLIAGLWLFGTGEGLVLQSRIGNSPWTVLAEGLSRTTHISVGFATFATSCAVMLLWIPLRQRPGLGTISNMVVIATSIEVTTWWCPRMTGFASGIIAAIVGTLLVGLGSGIYLTTGLGPGPRDGLMTSLHHRLGWAIAMVRLVIEVAVMAAGWLLGGTIGVGTAIFALLVPRAVAWGLGLIGLLAKRLPARD